MIPTNAENITGFVARGAGQRPVDLEGPPMFLRPNPSLPAQSPATRQFAVGWGLVDQINSGLSGRSRNWVLIDDVNNGAGRTYRTTAERIVAGTIAQTPQLGECQAFTNIPWDFMNHRGSWESDILARLQQGHPGVDSAILLGRVDAYFQGRKLTAALVDCLTPAVRDNLMQEHTDETLRELRMRGLPSLVVVHPREFRRQQLGMLTTLLGVMKREAVVGVYQRLTTESRAALLGEVYTHIWVNNQGEVESVTHPVWNRERSAFEHQEVAMYE